MHDGIPTPAQNTIAREYTLVLHRGIVVKCNASGQCHTPCGARLRTMAKASEGGKSKDQLLREVDAMRERIHELEESARQYETLVNSVNDIVFTIDVEANILFTNSTADRFTHREPGEAIGHNVWEFIHPDDLQELLQSIHQVLNGQPLDTVKGVHKDIEFRWLDGDGNMIWVACRTLPRYDSDGSVAGFTGIMRDITERKHAEQGLVESEERFRALIENSSDAIVILNRDGMSRYQSQSMKRVLGYAPEERIGKNAFEFVHPEDMPRAVEAFTQLAQDRGSAQHVEVRGRHRDGSWRVFEVLGRNLLDDPVVGGIVVNFRDITERKRSEEKLQQMYEQEKELRQQLEAEMRKRVEFTRTLAHELKTPLTSVLASSESLLVKLTDEQLQGLARNISRGASNLDSRIDELLDLARGEVGMLELKIEPVDMLQVLRDAVEYMSPVAASQGQSLIAELPSSLPLVRGDSNRLHQVVMNLLGNALKFTPGDGRIRLTAKSRDGSIVVEVRDTGPGIAKEDRDRLFEPYHRLGSDRGHLSGLGLGLALCKTLVELHGGEIWVRSRVGKGSTFGFSIPLKGAAGPSVELGAPAKLWKILIIEDDQSIVDSIGLAFQMDWPEAELISSRLGEEGVDMVEAEDPDIVILDLGLPDVSGFEVLRRVRLFSSVPVIVLTVRADEPDIIRGLEWGADDYIAKPFRQKELLARLKVQLRKQSRTDEEAPITSGPLRLDPTTYQLMYGSREISLTIIEGRIMQCLMRNVGNVVTHSRLAEAVWGEDYPGALDSLRVYIGYLRGKLEDDPGNPKLIRTKAGVGYSLVKPV